MEEILPSGNVAVGLVFNYFVGFLQHVLPSKCLVIYLPSKSIFNSA